MKSNGQIAYEAYAGSTGWKSAISGHPLPQWEAQAEPVRAAWEAAATAVAEVVKAKGDAFKTFVTTTKDTLRSEDECPVYSGGGHKYVASNGHCVCKCGAALP